MEKVNRNQISLIHVAKQKLGMTEEEYRTLLRQFNVTSSKELTYAQFERLVEVFEKLGFESPYLSYKQKARIKKLARNIYGEEYGKSLAKEIVKQTTYDVPIGRLSKKEASKVIIALEEITKWRKEHGERN